MNQLPNDAERPTHGKLSRWWRPVVKWSLFALVLVFVGRQAVDLCRQDPIGELKIDAVWLIPACVAYCVGWFPSVWFFRAMVNSLGGSVAIPDAARSYYCGHLGKYIPGKAMVIVIRAAILKDRGCRPAMAALAVTYETLALMGVGLVVATALAPAAIPDNGWSALPAAATVLRRSPLLLPGTILMAALILLPLLSRLFTRIAIALTPRDVLGDATGMRIETRLLIKAFFALSAAWVCHGVSLGFTLAALAVPFDLAQWPIWTTAVSSATAIGFLVLFAPGGLGVREGLLITLLKIQPTIGGQTAVAAALLLRAVWFVTEIIVAVLLYYGVRSPLPAEKNQEITDPC